MPHAVSSRKGGAKKGAPAHQNSWGFRHNKHSKVSKRIEAIPLDNVCRRCHDQLEWRKVCGEPISAHSAAVRHGPPLATRRSTGSTSPAQYLVDGK